MKRQKVKGVLTELPLLFVWNKFFCLCSAALCFRNNRYYALVALALVELNSSVNKCIQRIVLTHSHVVACVVLRATLANDLGL